MKKLLSIFLAVIVTFSLCSAFGVSTKADILSGECGEGITWTLNTETDTLEISGNGPMKDYTSSDPAPWHDRKSDIDKIIVKDGVTKIGNFAFYELFWTESVEIPDSVTTIGNHAFLDCIHLKSLEIPDTVTEISEAAFANCQRMESIKLTKNITTIESSLFFNCFLLKSIDIPDSVTSIGQEAFLGCYALTNVTIPDGVDNIKYNTFYNCNSMKYVKMPDSVKTIWNGAFNKCESLTDVYYSGSATEWSEIVLYANNDPLTSAQIHYDINLNDTFVDTSACSSGVKSAIEWAAQKGIINGYGDGKFGPEDGCTRQQTVIMLWRMEGKPEPASLESATTFTDTASCSTGAMKAIAWAVEQGIIKGYSNGSFGPTDFVTRQQIVIMFWRLAGRPEVETAATFTDTDSCSAGAMKAINWAASAGITKGSSNGDGTYRFAPDDKCQRQHIATFIYRYAK